jgi:hypothetical protein
VLVISTWGIACYPAPALGQAILEQRKIEVRNATKALDGRAPEF